MRFTIALAAASAVPIVTLAQPPTEDLQNPDAAYPVVITPTRLRQALPDVPASVTVITAATLRNLGIVSVPEALRLVPGMAVTRAAGNDWRISYHGTNILTPRRMNVLIDGVSVFRPAYSRVFWQTLPVDIWDIDRIEVTRGPNSASYGPNSMLAIINIITKHPKDVAPLSARVVVGSNGVAQTSVRAAATFDNTTVRVTASGEHDGGYDYLTRSNPQGHDAIRLKRLNARSSTTFGEATTLDLQAGYVEGANDVPFVDTYQRTFPDASIRDYYVGGTWAKQLSSEHELQLRFNYADYGIKQPWTTCLPTATLLPEMFDLWQVSPPYAKAVLKGDMPTGGSPEADALAAAAIAAINRLGPRAAEPTCVTANQDLFESRADFELQDTYVLSNALRVVSGLGTRSQRAHSQTFFGGSASTDLYRAFANAEIKPSTRLHINLGVYGEHESIWVGAGRRGLRSTRASPTTNPCASWCRRARARPMCTSREQTGRTR